MPSLVHRDGDDVVCRECEQAPPSGPCAACEALICPDCGVFSRDPAGDRVICLSCARLIADVGSRSRVRRRPLPRVFVALLLLAVFGAGALALLTGR